MQGDNASVSKGQGTAAPLVRAATNSPELEVKDAQLIFGAIWRELDGEFGRSRMRFPKELILLGGRRARAKRRDSLEGQRLVSLLISYNVTLGEEVPLKNEA
jgi:hypothetical protein